MEGPDCSTWTLLFTLSTYSCAASRTFDSVPRAAMRCVKSDSMFVSTSSTDCCGASSGAGAGGASSKSALSIGFILGAGAMKAAAPAMNALRSIIVWRSCGHYEAVCGSGVV